MPRYFFHLRDGVESLDHEGTELSGIDEAREYAVINTGEILRDSGTKFWNSNEWHLWVTDSQDQTVCSLKVVSE